MAEWRHASHGFVPRDAIAGGNDVNGEPIYVGRAFEDNDTIPGKIVPSHQCIYVPYAGSEKRHDQYEYLVRPAYGSIDWVPAHDGLIPSGAVMGGRTSNGETLYIGRAYHQGSWVIGKVHSSHRVLYIPFGGDEISISDYEVLVQTY